MINNIFNMYIGKKISLISILSLLLFAQLITLNYYESTVYTIILYLFLLIIIIYCLKNIDIITKINSTSIVMFLGTLLLGSGIVISSYVNGIEIYNLRNAIYYALLIITTSFFLMIIAQKRKLKLLFNAGKLYLIAILIANDFLMIAFPSRFYNIHGRVIGTCLIGNKFVVAYAHIALLFILMILHRRNEKLKIFLYGLFTIIVCRYVDCMTCVLGTFFLLVLFYIPNFIKKILFSPIIFSLSFFLSASILILFQNILNFGPVRFLIVDILHRDLTLTGRMEIYYYIFDLVSAHKLFGYGHSTNIVEQKSIWYANAQNAFWDFVISYGFITVIILFLFILSLFFRANWIRMKYGMNFYIYTTICIIYVYMFIGIGEIVYNKLFIFYAILLGAFCIDNYNKYKIRKITDYV